ncbi:MAG: hypothetical protein J0M02_09345, partial [Planctomycetes bacterium]|nr:hypothetical protein [Planctomycetota bacterium]
GLQACGGCAAALIVAGDQLHLRDRDLRRLAGTWRRRRRSAMAMQVAGSGPARAGILGVIDAADWAMAADRLAGRRLGVHRLWRCIRAVPVWFDAARLADFDRNGDLLKFRAFRGRPSGPR